MDSGRSGCIFGVTGAIIIWRSALIVCRRPPAGPGVRNLERDWWPDWRTELERCSVDALALVGAAVCVLRPVRRPVMAPLALLAVVLAFWADRLRRPFALAEASGPSGRPERLTDDVMVDE